VLPKTLCSRRAKVRSLVPAALAASASEKPCASRRLAQHSKRSTIGVGMRKVVGNHELGLRMLAPFQ
uniref:hypothetical protein n=1 Tax=Salmonella enterica TaxID=28901 RepID=UPI003FA6C24B